MNTRSPNTALAPQLLKCFGLENNVGFIQTQKIRIEIGIRQYHPIQTRDQILKTINGNVANLDQTDQGLACFNQLSLSGRNSFDKALSNSKICSNVIVHNDQLRCEPRDHDTQIGHRKH